MATGKTLDELSDKEKEDMKNKAKIETFFGVIRTKFMTIRLEEIAAISRDEPSTTTNYGGNLVLIFKSGIEHPLKYNDINERDDDFKKIDDAMTQASLQKPTKNLD